MVWQVTNPGAGEGKVWYRGAGKVVVGRWEPGNSMCGVGKGATKAGVMPVLGKEGKVRTQQGEPATRVGR